MLTNATQARSHELMLKQDQAKIQSSEGMEAVQEAYQYLIQVILCQKHPFLHQLIQNITSRVRSCDRLAFIRCTPILIWSFSKRSAIWSILIRE